MSDDLQYDLRHIGCFANGDAPCTCIAGHKTADLIAALDAAEGEIKRLQGEIESMRAERIERDRAALQENPDD